MSKILEGNIIKKPHQNQKYTKEQIEQLRRCSPGSPDPHLYFMQNFGYLKHPEKGKLLFKPFDYQLKLINNYHNYRFSINMLGRQMGKALSADTHILTPNGFVKMQDLHIGDYVYGADGKPTKIINKTERQTNRTCYRVDFHHGDSIIADAEHEWVVYDGTLRRTETFTTKELIHRLDVNKRNGQSVRIKKSEPIVFEPQEVPIDPYELGMWLGDGFSGLNKVTCHVKDYNEFKQLVDLTEGSFRKNSKTCIDFKLKSFDTAMLKEHNLYKNKHIPKEYIFNSIHVRQELLRGLMDTGGSIEKNGVCRFYQSDYQIIKDVRLLLSTLGIKSTLRSKETGFKVAYTLCFVCNDFDVVKLPRKLNRQYVNTRHVKNNFFYIKTIEEVESVPVYCIEVDNEDHLFLAGETLIPTHNCVSGDTSIRVRDKTSGEVLELPIEEFFDMVKSEQRH